MPTRQVNEQIDCEHFSWRVYLRDGVYYADGRFSGAPLGRHSLGTRDRVAAMTTLRQLDRVQAMKLGVIPLERPHPVSPLNNGPLSIADGRGLYEKYLRRPAATGGVKSATIKRYRTGLDKFVLHCRKHGIGVWNQVGAEVLERFIGGLEDQGYSRKSIVNDVTTVKQAFNYLLESGKLHGCEPIKLRVKKAESRPAYCWKTDEVTAMLEHTRNRPELRWLHNVILALACTGLRISELAGLRWSDVDLELGHLSLTDETGFTGPPSERRQLKSGRSRSFPIHRDLLALLKTSTKKSKYIFVGARGGKLKSDTVGRRLKKSVLMPLAHRFPTPAGARGFEHGTPHSFRHYFCSTCANSGVPDRIVMEWLGHADSEMVRRYYHLSDEESRRRMDQLQLLGGSPRGVATAPASNPS